MASADAIASLVQSADIDSIGWSVNNIPSLTDIPLPQADEPGLLAELSLLSSGNPTSVPLESQLITPVTPTPTPAPFEPCTAPMKSLKRKAAFSVMQTPLKKPALLSSFGSTLKSELSLPIEPVTPSSSFKSACSAPRLGTGSAAGPPQAVRTGAQMPVPSDGALLSQPLSPLSDSACSDDEADEQFIQASSAGGPFVTSQLPAPSKSAAAKRRALRSKALKRMRARATASSGRATEDDDRGRRTDQEGSSSLRCKSLPSTVKCEGDVTFVSPAEDEEECYDAAQQPMDKKIARAIRNRQAAQRSRVEAKAKMQKLAEDNSELTVKVDKLQAENQDLNRQLKMLLEHTFGAGNSVEEVLSVFSRVKADAQND